MANITNAERSLRYLREIKNTAQRVEALDRMAERENAAGNQHRRRMLEISRNEAQRKIDDAVCRLDKLGTVESEILKCLYVFGYPVEDTAKIVGYSEPRVWELARSGREKLFVFLGDAD